MNVTTLGRNPPFINELARAFKGFSPLHWVGSKAEARGGREPVFGGVNELPGVEHHLPHTQPCETCIAGVESRFGVFPVAPAGIVIDDVVR